MATNLSTTAPGLQKMLVGLGWELPVSAQEFQCNGAAFLIGDQGSVRSSDDFIFFNHTQSSCGAVTLLGDNLSGQAAGDGTQFLVDIGTIPADVFKIVFCSSIYEGEARRQHFGQIGSSYIRFANAADGRDVARYDFPASVDESETALVLVEIYRYAADWNFRMIGQAFPGGLRAMAQDFGVHV